MSITVVPHDPAWSARFECERDRIVQALGPLVLRVHHIGSTAVPGLPAKPIIDIALEVEDVARLDSYRTVMEGLGYEALGEYGIPRRRFFRKHDPTGTRTHHVHAFTAGDPSIRRHLAFRDYLIAHPDVARLYGELKRRLADEYPDDIEAYMAGKDPFIKEHEAKALDRWNR